MKTYSNHHLKLQQLIAYIHFRASRILEYGLLGICKKILKKIFFFLSSILFLPLSVVLYFIGYRRLDLFIERIGHLAIEPDTLLKAQELGLIKPKKWIVLAPKPLIANHHLMSYWRPYFTIIDSNFLCHLLHILFYWSYIRFNVSYFINRDNHSQYAYEINSKWGDRLPILKLNTSDEKWGKVELKKLGLPDNAWFVGIHAREGGFSPVDEALHWHRNGMIKNLFPAVQEIVKRGGWVIRLGDPSSTPLPKMPQVIDYARHPARSDRLDIILCARARFILGNTSGIFLVGTVFGTPCALANMIPMPTLGFLKKDLSIPKLYKNLETGSYLTFAEVMSSPLSLYRSAPLYKKTKLLIEENTADDILSLTIEMLERLENNFSETLEDKQLRQKYMSLMTIQHYSFGTCAKIQSGFLQTYKHLLEV